MKYQVDWHSWNTEEGAQKYMNKRSDEGYELVTIVQTGGEDFAGKLVLMYVWKK